MDFYGKHKKIITTAGGLFVYALGLFAVLFYLYKRCRGEYNADYTDTILWANASVECGKFCNPDYWYAYFLPFSGIPIMIPIVAVFGLTYFSHQLGMTVFVLIFAAALYFFMRSADLPPAHALALSGVTLIIMCASQTTRMIFYGHVIHYSLSILFMAVAFLLLKHSTVFTHENKSARIFTLLVPVWCMLCCTNGMATIILFFIPFVGSVIFERYIDPRPFTLEGDKHFIQTIALFIAGGLCGFAIKLTAFGNMDYEDSITALLPSDGWVWKQSPFLNEWIKVLTDFSEDDVMMMSFDGIRILCMYGLALIILIVPVFAAISYRKIKNRMIRLVIIFYWIMFFMTLLTYSISYALVSFWRLAGLACAAVITTLLFMVYMLRKRQHVRFVVLLIPVFAVCSIVSLINLKKLPSAVNTNQNDQLIEILKENDLKRGYSFFWNGANAVNVLSDNEIVISPIETYEDGTYMVKRYQSEAWQYEDAPGIDRYFVIVDGGDMENLRDTLGANKIDEIKYQDNLYIWVFDRNIFKDLKPVFSEVSRYDKGGSGE